MLTARKALAASRVYTEETVIGMGALKGANCTIKSITKTGDLNTVIFEWTDTEGGKHENTMLVYDGAPGAPGHDGDDGFSPTIVVKSSTSTEYILTITDKNGSYDTPNLKGGGGGGGGASSLSDLDDIALSSLANGDVLVYDSAAGKWKNVQLDIPTQLSDLSDIDLASLADADILKYDFASQKWVNGKLDYSDLTGTPTLGTAAEKDATNAITENSTDLIESGAVYTGLAAKADTADLGTAAAKDSTNAVTQSSTDLVESGAVYTALADKVDKEAGKGLSTNDFTDAEKSKLDNLELDDLSDVDMTGITDGQVLAWDDANSKMVPADQTGTEYTAGMGIDISAQNEISTEFIMYPGTKAEWDLLPTSEKIKYTHTAWDDSQSGIVDNAPTENSGHLVTSGGVFTALSAKANSSDLGTAAAKDSTNAVTQSSTDLVESGAVYTALGDKADKVTSATNGDFAGLDASGNLTDSGKKASDFATAQDLEDEISTRAQLGAHNLNIYPYKNGKAGDVWSTNGVDFTVNSDGSITADGTATADAYFRCGISTDDTNPIHLVSGKKYILSGSGQANVSVRLRNSSNTGVANATTSEAVYECSSTGSYYILLEVPSGITVDNLTIYPMLRLATDSDSTYEPYAKSNQVITEDFQTMYKNNGILGVKNLLPTPYYSTKGGTTTSGTLTVTENADGSVTIDGTASGQSYIDLARNDKFLKAGTYILSGGITSKQYVYINCLNNGTYIKTLASAMTSEVKFVLDYNGYDAITVGISIASGESLSNVTFYPMIRLASDTDTTYQPYAKTNRELTVDKAELTQISNPNLLDNPWFTVNQRGFSSKNDNGFTVDRWQILQAAGTVSLSNGAITIDPTVSGTTFLWGQTIENAHSKLAGKSVTLSVMLSDGTIKSKSFDYPTNSPSNRMINNVYLGSTHYFELYEYSSGHARVGYFNNSGVIPSAPLTIKAVKLELGNVSTLAIDTAPNFAQELLKCQYYFVNVFLHKKNYAGPFFAEGNANQLYFAVNLPVPMRGTPSIELDSENIYVIGNNAHTTVTTYTAGVTTIDNNVLKAILSNLDATEITDVNDHLYALNFFDSSTKKFWLSADI